MGLIKSENTPTEPRKPSILEKIQELKHMCMAKGRTPIILLMNKQHYADLDKALSATVTFAMSDALKAMQIAECLNLDVIINDKVTDFALVDERHWYEQNF